MSVQLKTFDSRAELKREFLELMLAEMRCPARSPRAVMLPGGSTPFEIYAELAEMDPMIDREFHIILSDERHVPIDSQDSNYGRMLPLLLRAGLSGRQILHPDCALPLEEAAVRYDHGLQEFFERDGRIALGVLGIGSDGHTASLFTQEDLENQQFPFAIPVRKPAPPDRISVTRELISRADRIIFLCTGPEKSDIVSAIEAGSEQVIAVRAVERVEDVQLWYSR